MDIFRYQPSINIADLKLGTIFAIGERRLVWQGELGEGELNVKDFETGELYRPRDESTGMRQIATNQLIQDAIAKGEFRILFDPAGEKHQPKPAAVSELDRDDLLKFDPYSEARQTLLMELFSAGAGRQDPNLSEAIERIWSEKLSRFGDRPCTSTVREWMTWTDPALPVLSQLVSHSGRVPRAKRLDPLVREIIDSSTVWYWEERGRQVKDVWASGNRQVRKLNAERHSQGLPPLKYPSREAYRRAVRASETPESYEKKFGKLAAERYWRVSGGGQKARHALELVLMDDTVLDAVACIQSVDGRRFPAGRPYICIAIDVATRCIVGWVLSFKPPTTHTAAECLKRVGMEKTGLTADWKSRYPVLVAIGGKPVGVGVDNGSNYISPAFQEGMAAAGITLRYAPVGEPKWKAIVERFFRTLVTWLLQKIPGHTLDPKTLRELNYDPATKAVLLVSELEALIEEFINVYHISIHSMINEQPAAAWLRSIEARPRAVLDQDAVNRMAWITVSDRRMTPNGIRWRHNVYRIGELDRLLRANMPKASMGDRIKPNAACTTKIKIDPNNVGHIWVEDLETRTYVELRAVNQRYAWGLTLDQHEQALAWTKQRNIKFNTEEERLEALASLNDYIDAVIPSISARERRAVARFTDPVGEAEHGPNVVHASARHDGLGEVIEHDDAGRERLDHDVVPDRPYSGVTATGGSHDADPREDAQPNDFDPTTGTFTSPDDDDERFEEDYS